MSATFPKTAELNLIMCVPNIFWYTVRQDLESAREILNNRQSTRDLTGGGCVLQQSTRELTSRRVCPCVMC